MEFITNFLCWLKLVDKPVENENQDLYPLLWKLSMNKTG